MPTDQGPPADGECGQALRPAVVGERIEEGVGRRVVALSWRGDRRSGRAEHHEEFQVVVSERVVQHPGPGDLGRHHRGEVGFAGVDQQLVIDRSGGVHDSSHGPAATAGVVPQPCGHLVSVGDIDTGSGDLDAQPFDLIDRLRGGRPPAAQQGDVPGSALGEVGGDHAPEGSGPTGDDVRGIRVSLVGNGRVSWSHGRRRGTNVARPRMAIWSSAAPSRMCSQMRAAVWA